MEALLFYLFSALILIFGIFTVSARRIYRAAIFLLLTVVSVAALYFLMEFTFLAVVQLVIYAGGIVVLILFSILLTHESDALLVPASGKRWMASFLLSLAGFAVCISAIIPVSFADNSSSFKEPEIKNIGNQLLNLFDFGYVLPFEAISILLLAALVGCIVVAMKFEKNINKPV